jgi:membrane protein DedA with SNARE-associated domain
VVVDDRAEDPRIPLSWLLTPIVVLTVAGTVADIVGPHLITTHPLVQMFFNPRNRYLLLASPRVGAISFFTVGFIRLVLTDPIGFVLGRQYGDAALKWAGDKMGDGGGFVTTLQRWFGKAGPVIILIAPNLYMCLLAGASKMRMRVFLAMNIAGTIGRLILIRLAGDAFNDELESALEFIQRNQWKLVAISFVVVALQTIRSRRRGKLETPAEIEREIEAAEAELEADPD